MIIRTANSVYEVDADKRVRRRYGDHELTCYTGKDDEWKQAAQILDVTRDGIRFFLFHWGEGKCTTTSEVSYVKEPEACVEKLNQ